MKDLISNDSGNVTIVGILSLLIVTLLFYTRLESFLKFEKYFTDEIQLATCAKYFIKLQNSYTNKMTKLNIGITTAYVSSKSQVPQVAVPAKILHASLKIYQTKVRLTNKLKIFNTKFCKYPQKLTLLLPIFKNKRNIDGTLSYKKSRWSQKLFSRYRVIWIKNSAKSYYHKNKSSIKTLAAPL